MTSALKDPRFLDFFYNRLQLNITNQYNDYPYISPCGKERNFVKSEDAPIVFHTLVKDRLLYAGTLSVPLEQFSVSKSTGKIYHLIDSKATFNGMNIGLLKTSLLWELDDKMDSDGFTLNGKRYPFNWIS